MKRAPHVRISLSVVLPEVLGVSSRAHDYFPDSLPFGLVDWRNLAVQRVIPRTDSPKLTFALAVRATHLMNDFRNKDAVRAHAFESAPLQVPRTKNSQQLATECRFYLDTLPTMATRLLPSGILMNRPGWVSLRGARFLPVTRRDPTSGERTPLLRRRFTPTSPTPLLASSP